MKDKINVAELLKDCPKGMELDCTMYDDVYLGEVSENKLDEYPITVNIIDDNGNEHDMYLTKEGCWSPHLHAKCIIFPKGKTSWEGFVPPCKFKDGDVLFHSDSASNGIFIFKEILQCGSIQKVICYCDYDSEDGFCLGENHTCCWTDSKILRPATKEQREILFQKMKEAGYKWNPDTKTLELIRPNFNDGDVIFCENHWGPFISIFKENVAERNGFIGHCVLDVDDNEFKVKDSASYFNEVRLATKREKELLFRAIERNGYKWDEETKTLEKLIESEPKFKVGDRIILKDNPHNIPSIRIKAVTKSQYILENEGFLYIDSTDKKYVLEDRFDITTLKPFDKVLVRDTKEQVWVADLFSHVVNRPLKRCTFACVGHYTNQCIPYEDNKHLLGKTDNCDDFYKTWQ